jgi:serine protease Do
MRLSGIRKAILPGALAVAGAVTGAWVVTGHSPLSTVATVSAASGDVTSRASFETGFAPVVKKVLPSVVNVSSTKVEKISGREGSSLEEDQFFRQFFGERGRQAPPRSQRSHGLGSGVIVSRDGYILTNNHVVEGADEVKVALGDRREFTAKVVGTDKKSDLAVLKIDAKDLPVVTLGDSSHVEVGDFALAIGNPFGVGQTVTMGIVGATSRGGLGIEDYEDFIQTDAAINPGNSGGALVNVNGDLIGINTAILTGGGGGNQGVGFAIPINMARQVMDQIISHGKVIRGWLGVSIQPVTPEIAKVYALNGDTHGAIIGDVSKPSPAEKAGLKSGDILLALNGTEVRDSRDLSLRVGQLSPGDTAKLKVLRDGKQMDTNVVLAEAPSKGEVSEAAGSDSSPSLGLSVQPVTPELSRELELPGQTSGLVVVDVAPDSSAQEAGLQRGDVIQDVNRKAVNTVADLQQQIRSAGSSPVLLLINRQGNHMFVTVHPR